MSIKEAVYETIDDHLIPIWRGGNRVPEMLRSYEDAPPSVTDGTNVELHCNVAVVPDGGIVDGNIVENSIVDRNIEEEASQVAGQTFEVPDGTATVQTEEVEEFTYFTEEEMDDNFNV